MRYSFLLFVLIILLTTSCSKGSNTPVSNGIGEFFDGIPVISASDFKGIGSNGTGLLGVYELTINSRSGTADLTPKRYSSIGESCIVAGIAYFTSIPCQDCFGIQSIGLDSNGDIRLGFQIRHPFNPGDPSLPPSGKNRLDLDLFDVAALVRPTNTSAISFPQTGDKAYQGFCVNADGYTKELANVIPDDAALPYVLVIDDSDSRISTWNKFAMGASTSFDIVFDISSGVLKFDLYLTMSYGSSAKLPERLMPKYYNPEFNRKAAWKVTVSPPQGSNPPTQGNTWQHNDPTTTYNIKVRVYDWQIGAPVYATPSDFANAPTDNIYAESKVASVSAEIPGMTNSLAKVTTPAVGTGTPDSPLVYLVPIANEKLLAAGEYAGLVKVTDSRPVKAPQEGRDFIVNVKDSKLIGYSLPEYAVYQTFKATIVTGGPISGSILSPTCPITGAVSGSTIDFMVTAKSNNNCDPIVSYEADWDYNGATFTTDAQNTTGNFTGGGPFSVPSPCINNVPQIFNVAFRATDSCVPPNTVVFATCEVDVEECAAPGTLNPVDVTPVWLNFSGQEICVDNGYAYILGSSNFMCSTAIYGMQIWDISNPSNAVYKNWLPITGDTVTETEASNGYLYCTAQYTGLHVIDISPPSSVSIVKTISSPRGGSFSDIYISGNYMYSGDNSMNGYLDVIDISAPASANIVKSILLTAQGSSITSVNAANGYAYIGDGEAGFKIVDIEPLSSPSIVSTLDTHGAPGAIELSNGYAYLSCGGGGLKIVDIQPPEEAHLCSEFMTTGYSAMDIHLVGDDAYVSVYDGIRIYDISSPESLVLKKTVNTSTLYNVSSFDINGNFGYVTAGSDYLQLIDISNPDSAHLEKSYGCSVDLTDVAVQSGYAYCAGWQGLSVFDVSAPESTILSKVVTMNGLERSIFLSKGYAYMAGSAGLTVLDIQPLESACVQSWFVTSINDVFVLNNIAYFASIHSPAGFDGLKAYDINDLDMIYLLKDVLTPSPPRSVSVSSGYAYMAASPPGGLMAIDIDPLPSANIAQTVDIANGDSYTVRVSGGYAYLADGSNGLQIIDIEPLSAAHIVSTVDTPGYAMDVYTSSGYAYIADCNKGLQIIDIEPPNTAAIVNSVPTPHIAQGVRVAGNYAYVADNYGGLRIIKLW